MAKKLTPLEKTSSSLFDAIPSGGFAAEYEGEKVDGASKSRISVWAIVSFICGLLSLLSLIHLGFLVFAAFGALASFFAFYAFGRSGDELGGKSFAALGLTLAVAAGIAGPYSACVYEREFDRQADAFCKSWFEALKAGNPAITHQMTRPYWQRKKFARHSDVVSYWKSMVKGEEEEHHTVHSYLCNPTLLTIYRLGDRAKVTSYGKFGTLLTNSVEQTERVYAVTVEPEEPGGKRQTFFLALFVERHVNKTPQGEKLVGWTMHMGDHIPLKLDADGRPIPSN